MTNTTIVSQARELAQELFNGKVRRESGKSIFEAHLEPVAMMVEQMGGDDRAIAAAYLHDAIEDIGAWTATDIEAVSPEVLAVVWELTEEGTGAGHDNKSSWEDRKASYLAHIPSMSATALLVSLADKIVSGNDFVEEFQAGKWGKRPLQVIQFYGAYHEACVDRFYALDKDWGRVWPVAQPKLTFTRLLEHVSQIDEQMRKVYAAVYGWSAL